MTLLSADRLDGIVKRKLEKPASMEDWLQSGLPDDYDERKCIEGKKRVLILKILKEKCPTFNDLNKFAGTLGRC